MIGWARDKLVSLAAAAIDQSATSAVSFVTGARRRGTSALSHDERLMRLALIEELYPRDAPGFFREARAIRPTHLPVAPGIIDLRWSSSYLTYNAELRAKYAVNPKNDEVVTRLFTAPGHEPRPVVLIIHGYLGGYFSVESRMFEVQTLLRAGLDVAMFTLPHHGPRGEARRRMPRFPSGDPRFTIEGFRQVMGELADLFDYLLGRGHPAVGLLGMSLGGYCAALYSTIESRVAFAVPLIPLSSLADWARDHGRLGEDVQAAAIQHAAIERVYVPVSPLHRAPVIPAERMLVLAAEADRITPVAHAERLSAHFKCRLQTTRGSHLVQISRSEQIAMVIRAVRDLGVLN